MNIMYVGQGKKRGSYFTLLTIFFCGGVAFFFFKISSDWIRLHLNVLLKLHLPQTVWRS